jgi:hypothetical protein
MTQTAKGTNRDKQGKSFVESPSRGSNYTAQEVVVSNKQSIPVTTLGVIWDTLQVTFPQQNVDLFTYINDGNIVLTVLVTYSSNNKKEIIGIQKEFFNVEV